MPGVLGGSTHRESPAHRSHRSGRSGAAQRAAKRVFFSSSQTLLGPYGTSRAGNNWACRQKKMTDDLTDGAAGQDRWHGRSGWLGLVRADGMAGWEAGQGRWPGWHGWMELARTDGLAGWWLARTVGLAGWAGWLELARTDGLAGWWLAQPIPPPIPSQLARWWLVGGAGWLASAPVFWGEPKNDPRTDNSSAFRIANGLFSARQIRLGMRLFVATHIDKIC